MLARNTRTHTHDRDVRTMKPISRWLMLRMCVCEWMKLNIWLKCVFRMNKFAYEMLSYGYHRNGSLSRFIINFATELMLLHYIGWIMRIGECVCCWPVGWLAGCWFFFHLLRRLVWFGSQLETYVLCITNNIGNVSWFKHCKLNAWIIYRWIQMSKTCFPR